MPDACADAVSSPSDGLGDELPGGCTGDCLRGGWDTGRHDSGGTNSRWHAPDRYCCDRGQAKPGIRHRSDSGAAAGMPHAKMDAEAAGAEGESCGETLSQARFRSCRRRCAPPANVLEWATGLKLGEGCNSGSRGACPTLLARQRSYSQGHRHNSHYGRGEMALVRRCAAGA